MPGDVNRPKVLKMVWHFDMKEIKFPNDMKGKPSLKKAANDNLSRPQFTMRSKD